MNSSIQVLKHCFSSVWASLALILVYGSYLVWQEQGYRHSIHMQSKLAPLNVSDPPAPGLFKPEAIAT